MKQCPNCNKTCYDTELFCPDCGCAMPNTIRCNYCGTTINDITATNCPNCKGLLAIDKYPDYKGKIHCSACGKPRPVTARFCTACGIASEIAPKPVINNSQNKGIPKPVKIALIAVPVTVVSFFIILFILIFIGVCIDMNDDYDYDNSNSYTYSYDNNNSTITANNGSNTITLSDADFRKINANDIATEINTIKNGDYLEITGIINERNGSYCNLIPADLNRDNKDVDISIHWEYDSEYGDYIADYCRVGDEITIRCKVDYVYTSILAVSCDGIYIVGVDMTKG